MELFLIELRDENKRTIRRSVRASIEAAKTLVGELLQEYIVKDYSATKGEIRNCENGRFIQFWFLSSNKNDNQHDLDIVLSSGRMDITDNVLLIPNEDFGKKFANLDDIAEYLINNYN